MANIQLLDSSGNWRTYNQVNAASVYVTQAMTALASRFPGSRVRAVDASGRLIDLL